MNLGTFVRNNRPHWQRLEAMLDQIEADGPRRTGRPFLRELSALYRSTTGDLAFAQTHFRGTTLLLFLHQLVARAHNQIYRPHRFTFDGLGRFFRLEIPQAVRSHFAAVTWATIIFLLGVALGLSAVQFDERAASIVLPRGILDSIYSGQMWTDNLFSIVPAPIASAKLFTNNISVALFAFAGGLSCGLLTSFVLFQNGFMLGVVFKLCANYGLLGALFAFIAGHGLLEISSILVAGGAGFVLANAILHPGPWSRSDALAVEGRFAVRMAVACVPALIVAGIIEAFVSPSGFPIWIKVAVGLVFGISFWLYLLFTGKSARIEVPAA